MTGIEIAFVAAYLTYKFSRPKSEKEIQRERDSKERQDAHNMEYERKRLARQTGILYDNLSDYGSPEQRAAILNPPREPDWMDEHGPDAQVQRLERWIARKLKK